jgi:hypothetical protein
MIYIIFYLIFINRKVIFYAYLINKIYWIIKIVIINKIQLKTSKNIYVNNSNQYKLF